MAFDKGRYLNEEGLSTLINETKKYARGVAQAGYDDTELREKVAANSIGVKNAMDLATENAVAISALQDVLGSTCKLILNTDARVLVDLGNAYLYRRQFYVSLSSNVHSNGNGVGDLPSDVHAFTYIQGVLTLGAYTSKSGCICYSPSVSLQNNAVVSSCGVSRVPEITGITDSINVPVYVVSLIFKKTNNTQEANE